MDPDQWQRLNELFLAAIELEPARRAAFLDEACGGDPALRAEVQSLVVSHEQAGSFMEAPAYEAEAEKPGLDPGDAIGGADSQSLRRSAALQSADESAGSRLTPRWWWEFHQLSVGLLYYVMVYPSWRARAWTPKPWGSLLFFATLAAVAVAANLRLHLWFTSRFYPVELGAQRGRVFRWVRASDATLALLFVVTAAAAADSHAAVATLFIAVAIGAFLGFAIIEPATTRAAFRRTRGAKTPRPASGSAGS